MLIQAITLLIRFLLSLRSIRPLLVAPHHFPKWFPPLIISLIILVHNKHLFETLFSDIIRLCWRSNEMGGILTSSFPYGVQISNNTKMLNIDSTEWRYQNLDRNQYRDFFSETAFSKTETPKKLAKVSKPKCPSLVDSVAMLIESWQISGVDIDK